MNAATIADHIETLELSPYDAKDLLRILGDCPATYGMTSVMVDVVEDMVSDHAPQHLETMRTFRKRLPFAAPFTPYAMAPFILTVVRMSTLLYPDMSMRNAMFHGVRASGPYLEALPIFQVFMKVADNDPGTFFEQSMGNNSLFQNFGVWDWERPERTRIVAHGHDMCEAQFILFPGYYQAVYGVFRVEGTFEGEWLGNGRLDVVASWK